MSESTTEAGRRLLSELPKYIRDWGPITEDEMREAVAAIEAEARTAALASFTDLLLDLRGGR